MSDKCRTDPECYWRRLYDEVLAAWHAEIVKRQDAQKSAREYGDLYVQARYALREARGEVERLRWALREVLLRHDDCDDGSGEICAACAVAMTVLGDDR